MLAANAVRMIRLDAVGYAVKRAGSKLFHDRGNLRVHPLVLRRVRAALGLEVLVEIHSHYREQIEIARHVDRVYDFALPPLVLHAFATGTSRHLRHWIEIRPANALTVLDTHDGIGVIDAAPTR